VLVKYVGWGAMPRGFAPQPPEEWCSVAEELKDLLSAQEYATVRSPAAVTAHRKVVARRTSSFALLANAEIGECREIADPILPFGGFRHFPDQDQMLDGVGDRPELGRYY
jgi:hypothetical protein